jgi:putative membrane protein
MKRVFVAATVVLSVAAVSPVLAGQAQNGPAAKPEQAKPAADQKAKPAADQSFVTDAAKGGMAEVELGKLATEKASSDQVKQFGQRMVDDHSKANEELKTLAAQKNITLPTGIDAKDKALHDRLSKLSGHEFDRAYMQAMVKDHRKDVGEFKKESTSGKDADVKAFAAKTLPTLEEHLKQAESTTQAVVGTSGSADHAKTDRPTDSPAPKSPPTPR